MLLGPVKTSADRKREPTATVVAPGRGSGTLRLFTRQPILNTQQKVYGYDLLFGARVPVASDGAALPPALTEWAATGDDICLDDLRRLCESRKAFVTLTRDEIVGGRAEVFPKDIAVIGIDASVEPEEEVLALLRKLRQEGYLLCLDQVVSCERISPFLGTIHFAKVDLSLTSRGEQTELVKYLMCQAVCAVAARVETREQFQEALAMGFLYFQGFFFAQPALVRRGELSATKVNHMRLIQAVHRNPLDLTALQGVIRYEPAFSFRLLRYLNSPYFGFRHEVNSVPHAINLLGEDAIRRWATTVAVTVLASDQPEEMTLMALRRAVFCEQLASTVGLDRDQLFLVGLLSLMDALLGRPMHEVLEQIPVGEAIRTTLLRRNTPMAAVLTLVEAYDGAAWPQVLELGTAMGINETTMLRAYLTALATSREIARCT